MNAAVDISTDAQDGCHMAPSAPGQPRRRRSKIWQKAFWLSVAILSLLLTAVGVYRSCRRSSDFRGLYESTRVLLTTGHYAGDQKRYFPTFQLLLLPLAAAPLPVAAVLWGAVNLTCLLALPALLRKLTGARLHRQILPWLVVSPFVWDNLVLGQSGPLLLAMVVAGLLLIRGRWGAPGGALIALAAGLKVIPAAFVMVPGVLHRARSVACWFVLATAAMIAGVFLIAGWDGATEQMSDWVTYIRHEGTAWRMIQVGRSLRCNNQGLAVTIARTLCEMPAGSAKGAVRLAAWPQVMGLAVYWLVLAAVALGWVAAVWAARNLPPERAWSGMFALTALLILFISPVAWTHYFIWWIGALVFLSQRRTFLITVGAISFAGLALVPARSLGVHIWLSMALYAVVLHDLWWPPDHAGNRPRTLTRRSRAER